MTRSLGKAAAPPGKGRGAAQVRRFALRLFWSLLGSSVTNGLAVGVGLMGIALGIFFLDGVAAASAAGLGVLVTTLPDLPARKHHKLQQMLPAPALGAPLFLAIQLSHHDPWQQGAVLVLGSFVSFMGVAWGKRGGPISVGMAFAMLLSMATPPAGFHDALERTGWFVTGAGLYLFYGSAVGAWLNTRYRKQLLAEAMLAFAYALRTQARRFATGPRAPQLMADMLQRQAGLADALQAARDVVLESPTRPDRQKRAAMLLALLEARDHLIACELDLDQLARRQGDATALPRICEALNACAAEVEGLATDLLLGRVSRGAREMRQLLHRLTGHAEPPSRPTRDARLVQDVSDRVAAIGGEIDRMSALEEGMQAPEIAAVRENWQVFTSPTLWSWLPLSSQRGWYAPTLRHALRVSAAVGCGYLLSLHLPWASHGYWILLTIIVVMRTNLAQTLERRNARVAGTLIGCAAVATILASQPAPPALLASVALATAVAHAFAIRRYLLTSIAATVSGLLQAHLLVHGLHTGFAMAERLADTVLGAAIAWLFCYVLPVWERTALPALVRRTVDAQVRHAELALALGHRLSTPQAPDLEWRLARREAYDSLSALVASTARTLVEPAAVRPPLEPLETLQARSYQLLAQLTAVKSTLQLRRGQLDMERVAPALAAASASIRQAMEAPSASRTPDTPPSEGAAGARPPDALADDLTPWLLHRLDDIVEGARLLGTAARRAAGG
ncbi:FUSC family membrane protein [uncultured Xylophilus sp.]|uniref:FUSC family protein n=1 Tax=uncultured Xylophilus sp. TaxID=296832 RepID=UPI0025EACC64|nr:FUSC family membrane protein [uncultured Xylophilus sp.]